MGSIARAAMGVVCAQVRLLGQFRPLSAPDSCLYIWKVQILLGGTWKRQVRGAVSHLCPRREGSLFPCALPCAPACMPLLVLQPRLLPRSSRCEVAAPLRLRGSCRCSWDWERKMFLFPLWCNNENKSKFRTYHLKYCEFSSISFKESEVENQDCVWLQEPSYGLGHLKVCSSLQFLWECPRHSCSFLIFGMLTPSSA